MRPGCLFQIHNLVRHDLYGPATPVASTRDPEELERMKKRLWGPLAHDVDDRVLIMPRWSEYSLESRLKIAGLVRRYVSSLIDTFWAGYSETERRELEAGVMEIYLDPAESIQLMPYSRGFVMHQAVHLITNDEEFTAKLVHQLVAVSSLEAFGKKKIPGSWRDPVAREAFSWWGDFLENRDTFRGVMKHFRGVRIFEWLGARVLELHREGRPLAGRFGDLYLFLRSHLPPTDAHLRWIDASATAFATLRAPGDLRPLESGELEKAWKSAPGGVEALKPGVFELALKGGFVTERFFGPPEPA